jgi:hypothetical protein
MPIIMTVTMIISMMVPLIVPLMIIPRIIPFVTVAVAMVTPNDRIDGIRTLGSGGKEKAHKRRKEV